MSKVFVVASVLALGGFATVAFAQQLPKSGSINFHTGFKNEAAVYENADKRYQGQGSTTGVTFNDKGSGPLHEGAGICSYIFYAIDGNSKNHVYCTWSDPDGDRIFTETAGTGNPDGSGGGTNQILDGTGKYAGIRGSGPRKCKPAGSHGEFFCNQRLDYRLP